MSYKYYALLIIVVMGLFSQTGLAQPCNQFSLGHDTTYCGPFARVLSSGLAGTRWSTGDTGVSITVTAPGTYWAFDSSSCGTFADTILLSQIPYPSVNFGQDTTGCSNRELVLSAANPGASYQWQDNTTDSTYTVTHAGTFSVIVTKSGCSALHSIEVTYGAAPNAFSLGANANICTDATITLNAAQPGVTYRWSTGDTASSITVSQAGKYYVTDSNACGTVTDSISITTTPCCNLLIPTAFSPNGDGMNDEFGVVYRCPVQIFSMSIFNRWGEVVYTSHDPTVKWDGTFKGAPQPLDVYVYTVTYTDPYTFEIKSLKGNVTLLR